MPFPKKRLIEALQKTILIGAGFHLILLVIYALNSKDYRALNIFNILDIDLFYPGVAEGLTNFWLSMIFISVFYLVILIALKSKGGKL